MSIPNQAYDPFADPFQLPPIVCSSTPAPFELARTCSCCVSLGISSNLLERNLLVPLVPLRLVHVAQMEKYSNRPTARRKDRMKDALAMMIASSGSRTVHRSPIGRVNVGSVKEMSIKEKMRMTEMAVTLNQVIISHTCGSRLNNQGPWQKRLTIFLFQRYPQARGAETLASAVSRCWASATTSP